MTTTDPTPDTPPASALITLKELAALLGIGVSTAERLKVANKLPPHLNVGGSSKLVRWERRLAEEWIAAGCPDQKTFAAIRQAKK